MEVDTAGETVPETREHAFSIVCPASCWRPCFSDTVFLPLTVLPWLPLFRRKCLQKGLLETPYFQAILSTGSVGGSARAFDEVSAIATLTESEGDSPHSPLGPDRLLRHLDTGQD